MPNSNNIGRQLPPCNYSESNKGSESTASANCFFLSLIKLDDGVYPNSLPLCIMLSIRQLPVLFQTNEYYFGTRWTICWSCYNARLCRVSFTLLCNSSIVIAFPPFLNLNNENAVSMAWWSNLYTPRSCAGVLNSLSSSTSSSWTRCSSG